MSGYILSPESQKDIFEIWGIGAMFTRRHNASATSMPAAPLISVRKNPSRKNCRWIADVVGPSAECARQLVDHPLLRPDDDVRERARRRVAPRQIARHGGEGHEDLVVVRPAVVAVLVLLPDLADDGVRRAVQRDRLADDAAL